MNYLRLVLVFDAIVYALHAWLDTRQLKVPVFLMRHGSFMW